MPEKRHVLKLAKGPLSSWQLLLPRPKPFYSAQRNTFWLPDCLTIKLQALLQVSLAVMALASRCLVVCSTAQPLHKPQ